MNMYLTQFRLSENWKPFLERLGFKRRGAELLDDGWSTIRIGDRDSLPDLGFEDLRPGVRSKAGGVTETLRPPSGIAVWTQPARTEFSNRSPGEFCLNHVALDVCDVPAEQKWFEGLLKVKAILAREDVFEPVSRQMIQDCHIYQNPAFYIALRQTSGPAGINHIGWMARSVESVLKAYELVRAARFPIVVEPLTIDGSFLFHFRGPDGRVHDFFFPLPELEKLASDFESHTIRICCAASASPPEYRRGLR